MNDPIIQFHHFSFQYRAQSEPTLHDIELEIRKGEKLLICGPSGCGKSTLAHCINGCGGSLTIAGRESRELGIFEISRTVGTVLQDTDGQFVGLTVAEDIAFAPENDCVGEPELHERVKKAAALVGVGDHLRHAPGELSGGQKQRVSLAGILVDDVDVLLFDEPLANLDPATGKQAIELIDEIQRKTGAAVVIIEHRLEDVLHRHVDRVVLMNAGRILADTTPDELLSGDLLRENGIREPLYITALKYAGVSVTADKRPDGIGHIRLDEEDMKKVRDWFARTPPAPPRPETPVQLEAKELRFAYSNGHEALHDLSLAVREGELSAIVGTNGAGKSTFCKLLCGFETQQEGAILLSGSDMAALSIKERADHIGYVMQSPNQMISQTMIYDEVALGLRTRGLRGRDPPPRGGDAEDLRSLALPQLAGLGAELRAEKARDDRRDPRAGARDHPPRRAHGRAGLPPLHRDHGVFACAQPPRSDGADGHARHASDARIRPPRDRLFRRRADRRRALRRDPDG